MARILVVDDEETIRSYLSKLIERFGHEPDTAETAAEARTKIAQGGYGMVIADIRLPDSPPTVVDWVGQLAAAVGATPLVLISGAPTPELETFAREGKVRAFLSKPFELAFIRNIVKETLG